MKIRLHFVVLIFLSYLLAFNVAAQPKAAVDEENDRMILAYTFYLKQKMSLEFVSGRFPSLRNYVENTINEWDREFIPSVKNIDSALTSKLNDEWLKNKSAVYEKFIRADYAGISEQEAKQFVDEVNDRAYGHIQSPILETFLIWNPQYQQFPEKEFTEGYVSYFSTKDQRNSLSLHVKAVYPRSWKAVEGNKKTNVVRNFISGYGLGKVSLSLVIEKSRNNFTKDRITQLLSKESMQKGLSAGNRILDYKSDVTIDNCNAASITFLQEKVGGDLKKIYFVTEMYSTYYNNYRIFLNFTVSSSDEQESSGKFIKYQKLFKKIVDNIVILTQWGQ